MEKLTNDDRKRLGAIHAARDPEEIVTRMYDYYHDRDRADRTSREQMYLHLGMLSGLVMRVLNGRKASVETVGWGDKREKSE
jgi:hypothetical protein